MAKRRVTAEGVNLEFELNQILQFVLRSGSLQLHLVHDQSSRAPGESYRTQIPSTLHRVIMSVEAIRCSLYMPGGYFENALYSGVASSFEGREVILEICPLGVREIG